MGGIYIENLYISYRHLKTSKVSVKEPYFIKALTFCKDYLNGKSSFDLETSGSTGVPNRLTLTRTQLKTSARSTIKVLRLEKGYRALVCISTDHIGGLMMLVRGMEGELDLYLIKPTAEIYHTGLPTIDFIALIPLQLQNLLSHEPGREFLKKCRVGIIGGAVIPSGVEEQLDQFETTFFQTFGMTETASHFALRRLNGPDKQQHYHSFEDVNLSIDERGCLVVNGEITNNKSVITNDLVELSNKNTFIWLGRWDRVINTGAYKVNPEKIEPVIKQVTSAMGIQADLAVIGLPHIKWGEQVTLVLEMPSLDQAIASNLKHRLKDRLHPYALPKRLCFLEPFPKTSSGKINFSELYRVLNREYHSHKS